MTILCNYAEYNYDPIIDTIKLIFQVVIIDAKDSVSEDDSD